jgi:hypothetical protein
MMADSRNQTVWQQGFVLDAESAKGLGLIHPEFPNDTLVVVVSHDCDLVENTEIEPHCEIIVGHKIAKEDGTYSKGKNPRKLHLTFSGGTTPVIANFLTTAKIRLEKDRLLGQEPADSIRLTPDEQSTLQSWLSKRYHRRSFPNEFDIRLRAKQMDRRLDTIIKATKGDLIAVLFDLDSGEMVERTDPDDAYSLTVFLLYDVSVDSVAAEQSAKEAAHKVRESFRQNYLSGRRWSFIELKNALPISEDVMTIHHWRVLKPWYLTAGMAEI